MVTGLAAWFLVTKLGLFPPLLLPAPGAVWSDFVLIATRGYGGTSLWLNVAVSLERLALGFGAAAIVGVSLGLAMGVSKVAKGLFDPLIEFYRPLPALGYLSLLVIWFGIGDTSKLLVVGLGGLPAVVLTTAGAVRSIRRERLEGAKSLGLGSFQLFRYVIVPSCLPYILTGLRVGFAFSFTTLVSAEMIGSTSGLGWMVLDATEYLQTSTVIVDIVLMGMTGIAVDRGLVYLRRRLAPWAGRG